MLGRLVPHKQVGVVLEAAAALRARHPDLVVDVAGQGYYEPELRAQAAAARVSATAVVFHGWVDEETKSDLLAQAWVNAVPSVKEGWALSVVEAASHGTPSIAFAGAGGLDESIVANVTGVLVDGGQAEFTRALGALLDDVDRREGLGRAAQRSAAAIFTWDEAAVDMAAVLDASMGQGRRRHRPRRARGVARRVAGVASRARHRPAAGRERHARGGPTCAAASSCSRRSGTSRTTRTGSTRCCPPTALSSWRRFHDVGRQRGGRRRRRSGILPG